MWECSSKVYPRLTSYMILLSNKSTYTWADIWFVWIDDALHSSRRDASKANKSCLLSRQYLHLLTLLWLVNCSSVFLVSWLHICRKTSKRINISICHWRYKLQSMYFSAVTHMISVDIKTYISMYDDCINASCKIMWMYSEQLNLIIYS